MAGINNLEIEIYNLFQERSSLDHVCSELITKYLRLEILSPSEIDGLSHFFIASGRLDYFHHFLLNGLQKNKINHFPIGYFVWAHQVIGFDISHFLIDLTEKILKEDPQNASATQVESLVNASLLVFKTREELKKNLKVKHLKIKTDLIDQLYEYGKEGQTQLEIKTLDQLLALFPLDSDIAKLRKTFEQKKADSLIENFDTHQQIRKPQYAQITLENEDQDLKLIKSNISQIIKITAEQNPEQLYNLAIMCFQSELYDECLQVLSLSSPSLSQEWLKAEALLLSRRYFELLQFLTQMTFLDLSNQEHVLALNYYKSISLYFIGKESEAIALLEQIYLIKPDYRSTSALLSEWTLK